MRGESVNVNLWPVPGVSATAMSRATNTPDTIGMFNIIQRVSKDTLCTSETFVFLFFLFFFFFPSLFSSLCPEYTYILVYGYNGEPAFDERMNRLRLIRKTKERGWTRVSAGKLERTVGDEIGRATPKQILILTK